MELLPVRVQLEDLVLNVLEEQPGGLVCHECGRTFPSLGLHAYRGHGMTAAQYRERHGLQRTAGLAA
jgi:predicted transcriptional regulator